MFIIKVVKYFGSKLGYHFTPDNTVVPVLYLEQFNRFAGPGRFHTKPGVETTLPAIAVGIRAGRYTLREVVSRDNICFEMDVVVRFFYDPRLAIKGAQSRIIHAPDSAWIALVEDKVGQAIRRSASTVPADKMCLGSTLDRLEQKAYQFLGEELKPLGMSVASNGVIIGEVRAPQKFKLTMLQVRQHTEVIAALVKVKEHSEMIEQAIKAELITSLETHRGNVTIMSPLASLYNGNGSGTVPPPSSPKWSGGDESPPPQDV